MTAEPSLVRGTREQPDPHTCRVRVGRAATGRSTQRMATASVADDIE